VITCQSRRNSIGMIAYHYARDIAMVLHSRSHHRLIAI